MEEVLKDFETFNEFPDKFLKVTCSSNHFLIKKEQQKFIVKSNIDSISPINVLDINKLKVEQSYYDIFSGALITKSIKELEGENEVYTLKESGVSIIPFNSLLNLEKQNDICYLSSGAVREIIEVKENSKTYRLE